MTARTSPRPDPLTKKLNEALHYLSHFPDAPKALEVAREALAEFAAVYPKDVVGARPREGE